ncbi:MAG: TlpA family protein disulfide reductase [Spirochaetaceae bacterium]|jgi:thiol-disulfide isomerase/thioredoxin|nr:TlpA family protein disulfide reductase [Spirochaetaceae bacterium]
MNKKIIFALTFSFLAGLLLYADQMPSAVKDAFEKAGLPVLKEKMQPKDFTLKLVDGKTVTLSALKGKIVFLNFWATWCPPCRAEMPSMEILYQHFKDKGLEFVVVDLRESKEEVEKYFTENKLTFPSALDSTGSVSNDYNVRAIPTTYIIDRDGQIVVSSVGARNWNTPAMIKAFEALLNNGE